VGSFLNLYSAFLFQGLIKTLAFLSSWEDGRMEGMDGKEPWSKYEKAKKLGIDLGQNQSPIVVTD